MSLFSIDSEGHSIVLGDGREVLVHDGKTEAPRWRCDTGAELVGVRSGAIAILTLDGLGELKVWSHETATIVSTVSFAVPATALVSDEDGRCAAIHPDGVIVSIGETIRNFPIQGAKAAAFGAEGELAIIGPKGDLHIVQTENDGSPKALNLGEPLNDIAWNPKGFFMLATQSKLCRVEKGASAVNAITNMPEGLELRRICASEDGSRIGVQLADKMALVMEYPSRDSLGNVTYGDRTISGIAFGHDNWFAVGLDGGDANKIDVVSGAMHRSDTHPGRKHNRWIVLNAFGPPSSSASASSTTPTVPAGPRAEARAHYEEAEGPSSRAFTIGGWICLAVGALFVAGPIMDDGFPWWVAGLMVVCTGFLGVTAIRLGRNPN